jgi:hypothetical protein
MSVIRTPRRYIRTRLTQLQRRVGNAIRAIATSLDLIFFHPARECNAVAGPPKVATERGGTDG